MDFYRIYCKKLHNSTNHNRACQIFKVYVQYPQIVAVPFETRYTMAWEGQRDWHRVSMYSWVHQLSWDCATHLVFFIPEAHVRAKTFPQANSALCHYPKLSAPVLTMEWNDSVNVQKRVKITLHSNIVGLGDNSIMIIIAISFSSIKRYVEFDKCLI